MAIYDVINSSSPLSAVEFKPVADGNLSFFHLRNPEKAAEVKQWLAEAGQQIDSETQVGDQTILTTHGSKSEEEITQLLKARDVNLQLEVKKRPFNSWAFRGNMSNIGQVLQLYSSISSGKIKPDLLAFSVLNLTANFINIKFGGQKEKDKYQLLEIKKNLNTLLAPRMPEDKKPPDMNISHMEARQEPQAPPTLMKRANDFMARNSVRVGEIGLRYLGSLVMVFPIDKWKNIFPAFKTGGPQAAFKASLNTNPTRFYAGVTYLFGKTIALFSKAPDPYNPNPPSLLDKIREKYIFKAASVIETGGASIIAAGAFSGDFGRNKPDTSDYISGVGGSVFMAGLITRIFAPFGKKLLNVDEAFAYTSDALANVPQDKLPQAMADSAGLLLKYVGKTEDFGDIYTRLMVDLYRYHHVTVGGSEPMMPEKQDMAKPQTETTPKKPEEKQEFANPSSELLKKAPYHTLGFSGSELLAPAVETPKTV